ncbi:TIGR04141 family sporadically distributed protein [Micromonospora fiedleri]|uniref:TIGR04141 family sporadically distributed protein n=1 Tax=Micromonospora fiedleri TaxID=1157498 RepID=A0ABS1UI20_9ACTN|nr:DUF6119 family protein [Micromonospora fiedleri]MBL6275864.1 TIGR04141 family sporadically distributed protein [Micromonospora fiedleri]
MDLALYLLRDDLDEGDWGLRSVAADYKWVEVKNIPGIKMSLFVRTSKENVPAWQEDLMKIAANQQSEFLKGLQNKSTGALLLVERRGRRFVLVYGSGRHAVDPNSIETGFGLQVAANVVDPESLRGVDTRSILGSGRSQTVSLPSAGPLYRLGIEPTVDLVRYLEGRPPEEFANGIAGGDVLRLNLKQFSFRELPTKLDEVLEAFESREYKDKFPFLDYFSRVSRANVELCSRLSLEVEKSLRAGERRFDFMIPDLDRQGKPEKFAFRFGRRESGAHSEISKEVVLDLISRWKVSDPLKNLKVRAFYEGIEKPVRSSLLPYVVGEVRLDDTLYAPCAGVWYRIDPDHLKALNRRIEAIVEITEDLALGPWGSGYADEGDYNSKATPRGAAPVVLDKNLFYSTGGRNLKVEVCDLLTERRELICVKKMTESATLSHLFAQGSVSARLFRDNLRYRDTVLNHLRKLLPDAGVGAFEDWTVVFAIATERPGRLSEELFFFSKVNLDIAAQAINGAGMRVALAKIDLA